MAPPVRQTDHVGIRVRDLDAVTHFYSDILGLPIFERASLANGVELVFLEMGSAGYVELIKLPQDLLPAQPIPAGQAGLQHFALQVEDLDDWVQYFGERHVPLMLEPLEFELPSARCRRLYVADPEGNPVELFERRTK
jgi:catechol-2,3-dioxygenase